MPIDRAEKTTIPQGTPVKPDKGAHKESEGGPSRGAGEGVRSDESAVYRQTGTGE